MIIIDIATTLKPQVETNPYQEVHLTMNEITSPVILTSNRSIDDENPYHVSRSEVIYIVS